MCKPTNLLITAIITTIATGYPAQLKAVTITSTFVANLGYQNALFYPYSLDDRAETIPAANDIITSFVLPTGLDPRQRITLTPTTFSLAGWDDASVFRIGPIVLVNMKTEYYCKGSLVSSFLQSAVLVSTQGHPVVVQVPASAAPCDGRAVILLHGAKRISGSIELRSYLLNSYPGTANDPYLLPLSYLATINYTTSSGIPARQANERVATFHLDLRKVRTVSLGLSVANPVLRGTGSIGVPLTMDLGVEERAARVSAPRPTYTLTLVDTHGCDLSAWGERVAPDQPLEITVKHPPLGGRNVYRLSWTLPVTLTCPTPGRRLFNLNLVTKIS